MLAVLNVAGNTHCYRFSMDGEATRVIGGTGSTGWPTISVDGTRLAFPWTGTAAPPEIWTCEGNGGTRRQLTGTNSALMDEVVASSPERFAITAGDGREVESILWLPPGKTAADGPFPTLLHLHGGPHGAVGEAFSTQQQILATHGFAVFSINFRGSAGYGKAFADTILADWGAKEHADSMTALDALVARGIADPHRLGVFGGSYGGYMTNYVITHTDRFRAAVTMATISDLATLSGTTDQWESIDFDSGGAPWEEERYYREHSAMPLVARITTPLLIMHGEEDYTCRVTEAEQLFVALRKLRREVEFVRYPGESHGFTRGRPRTQQDALTRLLGWFVDHLMT
ncbi:MAG: S9 family peptidase [Chloroflexota bacterium]|nr:S9 family peptidase [Chloroflexota bacterium]